MTFFLKKLSFYGIRGIACSWFESYLTNRKQCVHFNNCLSDFKVISCGVPQGSLLGPLLFLIYINDMSKTSNLLSFILYADDTSICYCNKSLTSLYETVNNELIKICDWFKANRLSINLSKCNFMIFSNRKRQSNQSNLNIVLDNTSLKKLTSASFWV